MVPENGEEYFNWLGTSGLDVVAQLWWAIVIPAWYCEAKHITVAREAPRSVRRAVGKLRRSGRLDTCSASGFAFQRGAEEKPVQATTDEFADHRPRILFFLVPAVIMLA